MKKFINTVDSIVQDTIGSFVNIHQDTVRKLPNAHVVARKTIEKGKVGVVIGNGSGHEPACIGFVGKNALDCNAYGYLFAAPGPDTLLAAIKEADQGAGVVVLISNHAGDVLNSRIAVKWAIEDGIDARYVILYDDVLSAPKDEPLERRGTAGTYFNYRMAGAYAAEGHSIDEVVAYVEKIRDNTRTVTVASLPGISPITGKEMFSLPEDEYQLGVGVHGESSPDTVKVEPAQALAKIMTDILLEDGEYQKGDELLVLVNGCGGTTDMELLIFCGEVRKYLESKDIVMIKPAVGSFITTQEMQGIALAFCRSDETMQRLWFSETDAPGFPKL
ncbi:PTS-dependent dihydroxyacetone kinase, dihydroxyacetone-binding subunit DhaK [Eubacterium limosum]|uniref:PTS-dependent dihydroxyacetone kinase, dihydroxyacetone-binding subunit DhaK n=1 Tax=Eubacterium limosum TaxID=1736 RepID=A0A6N3HFY2_EUBLI